MTLLSGSSGEGNCCRERTRELVRHGGVKGYDLDRHWKDNNCPLAFMFSLLTFILNFSFNLCSFCIEE